MKTKLLLTLLLGSSATAEAALQSRAGGMVYDTDLDITWVADANLFKTQATGNVDLVSQIIAANGGVVPGGYYGIHNLIASDFNTGTGGMTWWGAQAWANSLTYGSFSDWRLPTTLDTTSPAGSIPSYNIAGSEMGHLFYSELGGTATLSIVTNHNADYNLFSNIPNDGKSYWSSREAPACCAYSFGTTGSQGSANKSFPYHAWAVRDGDVAAIPVPGAVWLFGSGLIGLTGLARKRKVA